MYDVIVVGGGPAGLTAALYAVRYQLKVLVLEAEDFGGTMAKTGQIENYMGSPEETDGTSLSERMRTQAEEAGADLKEDRVTHLVKQDGVFEVQAEKGSYKGKTVIWAGGTRPRGLGLDKEESFIGRGISFCASCDGPFYAGLPVYIVGGGDSAFEEGSYLAKMASKVTIFIRKPYARAAEVLQDRFQAMDNTKVCYNSRVIEYLGDEVMTGFVVENTKTGEKTQVDGNPGLFLFTGNIPNTGPLEGLLDLKDGYVQTDAWMRTDLPGLFAAGDVRDKLMRQIVTASSDGAVAARAAGNYLASVGDELRQA